MIQEMKLMGLKQAVKIETLSICAEADSNV
jgi:hypothetical protein